LIKQIESKKSSNMNSSQGLGSSASNANNINNQHAESNELCNKENYKEEKKKTIQ